MNREQFRKIYAVIDRIRTILVIAIFGFIVTVGAVQIFMRYTPGINAMSWVDEIMRYLNVWLVLLATSIGVKQGAHFKMDYFLHKFFSKKGVRTAGRVIQLAVVISLLLLVYFGILRVFENRHTVIQSLPLSIALFYTAIPVGCLLILLDYVLIAFFGEHPYAKTEKIEA